MGITNGIKLAPLLVDIKADIKGFKDSMSKAATAGVAEAKKISKSLTNVTKVGDSLSNIGGKLTKFVSVPLAGVGVGITKMAMDFESGMAKVSTIADTSKKSMDELKKGILKLSSDTGSSVADLSEGLYQAISASVDTADSIEFLGVATKAAKGGFTDTATAVDGLSTVLNSYGLKATEVDKIANQMLITQNKGKTSFGELASAVGKVTPVAANLGVTTEELFSSLASTTAQGLATSESVNAIKAAMSNIIKPSKEASEIAEQLGIDFSVSALQSKGWIGFLQDVKKGLENASPEFKRLQNQLAKNVYRLADLEKQGKKNTDEYKNLKKENNLLSKSFEQLLGASDSQIGGFASLFGSVEGLNSILMLTSDNGMKIYNDTMVEMKNNTTALDDAYKKMDQSPMEQFKKSLNKLKNAGIELGIKVIPVALKIADMIGKVADKFSNLSDEQQNNILKWGAIAIAAGPALKIVGGGIKVFATLKSVIGGVSKALSVVKGAKVAAEIASVGSAAATATGTAAAGTGIAGFVSTLGGVAVAAAPFVAVAATIAGSAYIVNKSMSRDCIEPVDLFAEKVETSVVKVETGYGNMVDAIQTNTIKISDATKSAVGAYMDMDTKTAQSVYDMYIKHTTITDDIYKDMTGKFAQMGKTIKDSQQQKYSEMLADYKGFFDENSTLTYGREQEILQTITTKHNERQQVIDDAMKRINTIYDSARDMHRDLTEQEMIEIGNLQGVMKEKAVNTLSETEQEAAVIRERMAEHDGRLTVEMASNAIKQANNARDKEIKAATDKYEGIVKKAATLKAAGDITQEEYDKMVKAARETKDEQIKHAMLGASGIKNEIEKKNPGIWEAVDKQTGEIRDKWSRLAENIWGFVKKIFGWGDDVDEEADRLNKQRQKEEKEEKKNWKFNPNQGNNKYSFGNGSRHFNGLNYVPFDGYSAILHKGERVLTREENKAYNGITRDITQNVTINSPKALSPTEIAQQNKYMLQQLALEM